MIPNQLKNRGFRFIRVSSPDSNESSAGKKPKGFDWQNTNNDEYDSKRLKNWIETGGNYGVVGGFNGLMIIDCDKVEAQYLVEEILPKSFTVKTSGGYHNYYICNELKKKLVLHDEINNIHYGEIQSHGSMVVGPNSIHKTRKRYKIIEDIPIREIPLYLLENIIKYLKVEKTKKPLINNGSLDNKEYNNIDYENINPLYKLKLNNVINIECEVMKHPYHESETGANFTISGDLAHCWRHSVSLNAIQLLAIKSGYVTCEEAGTMHHDGRCRTHYERLIFLAYLQAMKDKIIPRRTVPPQKVLQYLCKMIEMVKEDKIWEKDEQVGSVKYDMCIIKLDKIKKKFFMGDIF